MLTSKRHLGNLLQCVAVSDNLVSGAATLTELANAGLMQPTKVDRATATELKRDEKLNAVYELRKLVQRRFDQARLRRVKDYTDYINGLFDRSIPGGTPPLTLYAGEAQLEVLPSPENAIVIPYMAPVCCLDAETQTEARFQLWKERPETGAEPIPFVLYHGISAAEAGAILHDVNHYANPVAERTIASLNARGSVSVSVNAAIDQAEVSPERILRTGSRLNKSHVTSFSRLAAAAAGFGAGHAALMQGGVGKALSRFNGTRESVDIPNTTAFVARLLKIARDEPEVGRMDEQVWALAGVWQRQFPREPMSLGRVRKLADAYQGASGRGRLQQAADSALGPLSKAAA